MPRGLRARVAASDLVLAAGFAVAGSIETLVRDHGHPALLLWTLAGAPVLLCLALRRVHPLAMMSVLTLLGVVGGIGAALVAPHARTNADVPVLALLVASYSLGVYGSRRQLLLGAWQPVLAVVAADLLQPADESLGSALPFVIVFVAAAPIAAGRVVRGRSRMVQRLREQTAQIQAAHQMQVEAAAAAERLRMADRFHESLLDGVQHLACAAAASDTADQATLAGIESGARELLTRTREEVLALTAPVPPSDTAPVPPVDVDRKLREAAQPWTALSAGALCVGLLVETRTLPLHVATPVAWAASVALALPLGFAWLRPAAAVSALWLFAAGFSAWVAPLSKSFAAVGLSFVAPFAVAALSSWRAAVAGLGVSLAGQVLVFGASSFPGNAPVAVACWVAGLGLHERSALVERLRANTAVLEAQRETLSRYAAERERLRFARELHDAIGHSLTVIALQAGAARRLALSDPVRAAAALRTIAAVAQDGVADLRAGVGLDAGAAARSVGELVARARAAGLALEADITAADDRLTPAAHFAVYRVVQEALTNVLKHAPGARARLSIEQRGPHVEVVVANEAGGRPGADAGTRHGLRGMRQRVEASGGTVDWQRSPDGRFEVRARLPVQAPVP
jgi:signal transduction histidine kinase